MIVLPQINSLNFIIVPLSILLIALGFYSYNSYDTLEDYENYIIRENELIEEELADMILSYHDLEIENDSILNQLEITKVKIFNVLDSMESSKPKVSLVRHYKKELLLLKEENNRILNLVEQLERENSFLKNEVDHVGSELEQYKSNAEKHKNNVTRFKSVAAKYKRKNLALIQDNKNISSQLDQASRVLPNGMSVSAVKRLKSNSIIVNTKSARRTKKLNICFTLPANLVAEKGKQAYYLQVIDPNNNVIGDLGDITIGSSKLITSKTVILEYSNKAIEQCEFVEYSNTEKFVSGTYYVGLYNNEGLILNTSFSLK